MTTSSKISLGFYIGLIFLFSFKLIYTHIPKTFNVTCEDLWNEFRLHPKISEIKYKKSTITLTGVGDSIESFKNDDGNYTVVFYFDKGIVDDSEYKNGIFVQMNTKTLNLKENEEVKIIGDFDSGYSSKNYTNIYLLNGRITK